ncbi:AraC family transcriptional regulator [Campylobacter sp. JMF_08 NE1]|uniref:AraC family transcriptional regulator n=1 Tax=Campylobacter sp. JMF_08 NE1 TaxID=2983821 RepID=UPI0022EA0229|nr:AraC family transcriptional regulator [Campylobacter sp. JMF_08 NE1]MDA3047948.1 AraC family transcriptional regulator [Campylobacter sp. JMF_08 NE1]
MKDKNKILDEIANFIDKNYPNYGVIDTQIEQIKFYRADETTEFRSGIYKPSICIALRGNKLVKFNGKEYFYNKDQFMLTPTHIPISGRVTQCPLLSIIVEFKVDDLAEAIKNINFTPSKKKLKESLYVSKISFDLADSIARLVHLLERGGAHSEYLVNLSIKEVLYSLMSGDEGAANFLYKFILNGTMQNQIAHAISEISAHFNEAINMSDLAEKIGISVSSFYHNFKKFTALSPLEFQKRIRLEEAKFMLLNTTTSVSQVAFDVGYESTSQFSREYARMYGLPPKAHIQTLKELTLS